MLRPERQWLFVLCRHCGRFRFFRLRRFLRNGRHYRRRRFLRKRQTEIGEVQIVKIDLRQAGLRLGLGRRCLRSRLRILRRQGFLRLLFCSGFRQRLFRFRFGLARKDVHTGVLFHDLRLRRRFGSLRFGCVISVGKRRFAARYGFAVFPLDLQDLTHRRTEAADDRRLTLGTGFVKHALIPVENALALGSVKKRQQAPQLRHEAFSVQRGTPPIRTVTICHR